MKKYIEPNVLFVSVDTADIMSTSPASVFLGGAQESGQGDITDISDLIDNIM